MLFEGDTDVPLFCTVIAITGHTPTQNLQKRHESGFAAKYFGLPSFLILMSHIIGPLGHTFLQRPQPVQVLSTIISTVILIPMYFSGPHLPVYQKNFPTIMEIYSYKHI